jgi:lipoyl-dependent peroxiredoxin
VTIDAKDIAITRSDLAVEVRVDGLDAAEFQEYAERAKSGCAVSRALGAIEIGLEAHLASVPAG